MPFGLKNAGVTFQRLMHKALGAQMGRNVEAYVDDIIVKTREGRTLVEDLEETFANLRKVNINLNPTMCLWCTLREATRISCFAPRNRGKPRQGQGHRRDTSATQHQGNAAPRRVKAALGRFIMRSGEKGLPFFQLMKRTEKFEWTPEADKAFAELKRYLTSPPIMVAPWPCEPLLLYIAATLRTASAFFVAERDAQVIVEEKIDAPCLGAPPEEGALVPVTPHEEPPRASSTCEPLPQGDPLEPPEEATPAGIANIQKPIYFVNIMQHDTREHYTTQEKLLYTLLIASRKLRHYFHGHPIKVVIDRPLEQILCNPNVTGWVAECVLELQRFDIAFEITKVIKSKALDKFTVEWTDPFANESPEVESTLPGEEAPGLWVLHFDGAFNLLGARAGAVLTSPSRDKVCFKLEHKVSNNITKYEGLLTGLEQRAPWASRTSLSRRIRS
jgi:hypothetical protein